MPYIRSTGDDGGLGLDWSDITSGAEKAYNYGAKALDYGQKGKALVDQGVGLGQQVKGIFTGGGASAPPVQPVAVQSAPGVTYVNALTTTVPSSMAARARGYTVPRGSGLFGLSNTTLLLGGAGLAAFLLLRKRKR